MIRIRYVIASFFAIILIILSISIIFVSTHFYEDLVIANTTKQISEQLKSSANLLELKLDTIYGLSWAISQDSTIQPLLFDNNMSLIEQTENARTIQDIIINYSNSVDFIKSINIFSRYITIDRPYTNIFIDPYSISYGVYSYLDYKDYIESDERYPYKRSTYIMRQDNDSTPPEIVVMTSISNISQQEAVLGISTDKKRLYDHYNQSKDSFYGNTIIIDSASNLIYKPDDFDFDLSFLDSFNLDSIDTSATESPIIYTYEKFNNLDWYSINIATRAELIEGSLSTRSTVIMMCIILLLLSVVGSSILSSYITKPLSNMVMAFKSVQQGSFSHRKKNSKVSEINDLYANYDLMVQKIRSLLEEVSESHRLQNEYAFQALQAQINPHLLSNTLDAVYWMSDNDEICKITQHLANFYRLSLSSGQEIISVNDEISHASAYVNIMQIRFKGKFEYTEEIDPHSTKLFTPKMILQPVIENAILHGMKYMRKDGQLTLRTTVIDDRLIFTIEDNGIGVNIENMRNILEGHQQTSSYGVKNIHKRIQLKYGQSYGISYENGKSGGTVANISIPLIKGDM